MGESTAEIKKHVKLYWAIFGALAVLTVVTVAAAKIEVGIALGVVIAMAIAISKASLVAGFFMHLLFERQKALIWLLVLCAFFFVVLMLIPVLAVQETASLKEVINDVP